MLIESDLGQLLTGGENITGESANWDRRLSVQVIKDLSVVLTSTRWYELLIIAINMFRRTMSEAAWYRVNRVAVQI